ncbi:MAG: YcjF family protein [Janthinobacterium lividum]
MPVENFNIADAIKSAYEKALSTRGHVNILIAGKTGTGKSTLVNTIFSGRIAETGQGRPVTQHMRKYTKDGSPVSIYDSKGLELSEYKQILGELITEVRKLNRSENPEDHIHVSWLCIAEGARRFEDAEVELAQALDGMNIPVIIVITTAISDQGFRSEVEKAFDMARNVVRVNCLPVEVDDGVVLPVKGVDDLVDITMEVVPKGQKNAFAAAQRIKVDHKVNQSRVAIVAAAASAAAVGIVPIPFSDAVAIIPIQISMLAAISVIFGLNLTNGFLTTLVATSLTSTSGAFGGRALVGGLLKLIPGAGSILGGAISAGVAIALTTAFGEAYIAVLKQIFTDDPDSIPEAADIAEALKEKMKSVSPTLLLKKS